MSHVVIIKSGVRLTSDFLAARQEMVETQLRRRGIDDPRVLDAMLDIPREEFVARDVRDLAYGDDPIPIGYGQTISQPYMTALMAQLLELNGTETVLEVGTGSGYAAAVLGALAARVVTIERIPELTALAEANLRQAGRDGNVTVVFGDGSLGFPDLAPYDAISVAAAAPDIPHRLLDQLKDPGRLVIPVGELRDQELRIVWKRGRKIKSHVATLCRFVPLVGGEGQEPPR